jgi:hypothetical protein
LLHIHAKFTTPGNIIGYQRASMTSSEMIELLAC